MTGRPEAADCPWCGPMNGHYGYTLTRFGTRLTCFCCDSHGPRAPTKEEALAAWNTRAAKDAPQPAPKPPCKACNGTGRQFPYAPPASLAEKLPCDHCGGSGVLWGTPCGCSTTEHDPQCANAQPAVPAFSPGVRDTALLGWQIGELIVDLCEKGIFPAVGVDDGNEFALGPFRTADGKQINGCASVFWDEESKGYRWSIYASHNGKEARGDWPIGTVPKELIDLAALSPAPQAAKPRKGDTDCGYGWPCPDVTCTECHPTANSPAPQAEAEAMEAVVKAARALHADMLERARTGTDAIHGHEYRIVNAGRTAWHDFDAALAALRGSGK